MLTIKCKDYIERDKTETKLINDYYTLTIEQFELKPHTYRISCDILNNMLIHNKLVKELYSSNILNQDMSYSEVLNKYITSIQLEIFSQTTGEHLYAQYPTFFYLHFRKNEDYQSN